MTKRELIDEIRAINRSADPAFLAEFGDADLDDYLRHLRVVRQPRPMQLARAAAWRSRGRRRLDVAAAAPAEGADADASFATSSDTDD